VEDNEAARRTGLCVDCHFGQRIQSVRGSVFLLCQRSRIDPAFPKYPQLPVLHCAGYVPKEKSTS